MVEVVILVGSQTFTEQGFRFRIIRVGFSEDRNPLRQARLVRSSSQQNQCPETSYKSLVYPNL